MSHKKLDSSPENLFLSATYALCRPLAPSSVAIFAQILRRCSRSLEVCYSNHFLLPVEPFFFTTPTLFYAIPTSPIFLPGPIFYPLTHFSTIFHLFHFRGHLRVFPDRSLSYFCARVVSLSSIRHLSSPLSVPQRDTLLNILDWFPHQA